MLKAVIFDMDGVLIDSEPVHFQSDVEVLKKFDKQLSYDFYKQFIGSTMLNIWNAIRQEYRLEQPLEELMQLADEQKDKIIKESGFREIKGVVRLVENVYENGYLLAVASSSPYDYIEKATKSIKARKYFHSVLSGARLEHPKPAPDIFLDTARNLKVEPEECIVIEDSTNGVAAAKAAGMVCVGFVNPNSGEQDLSKADCLVESFENIDFHFLEMVYCHQRNEPWKVLETENLIIREICLEDLDELYSIYADKTVTRYIEDLYERPKEIEFTKAYIKNMYAFYGYGLWVVILKHTGKLIGRIGLSNREVAGKLEVELGYLVGTEYQNKGYAFEACTAILEFARNKLCLEKLNIFTQKENSPSVKLARKLGFHLSTEVSIDGKEHSWYELLFRVGP